MLLQPGASPAGHPLAGTAAEYIWLVLLLPLIGAVANGVLTIVTEWRPGPFDPDPGHTGQTGEFEVPAQEAHRGPVVAAPNATGDHADQGIDLDLVAPAVSGTHRLLPIVNVVAVGVMAAAFALAAAIFAAMNRVDATTPFIQTLYQWMPAGNARFDAALHLDRLSMVMTLVITGVGTLIHLFSIGYMDEEPAYARYFAYLNLFVFFMLLLVLGANYPLMFVGWEGVGLCSYLLIGFWFVDKANADAGKKAFIVNRIGDFGLLVAMFMMFWNFGTLDFTGVQTAAAALPVGSVLATTIALFIFLGCTGKSAQIPLYVWLPDAMAGPTPVSALIHAATMVTAGVYLVARSSALFAASPVASLTVVVIGAVTAVFAASIGLKQWDIKKVLAYSTVSQLGYMFMAVGAGAYSAGIFHLVTHAFFKALLFLGAGSVIHAVHEAYHRVHVDDDAQDMRNMGGLRRYMPVTFATMWIATLAISGVPPFSGFFSKDEILGSVFTRASEGSTLADASWLGIPGSAVLYAAYVLGLAAAFMTAVYMTRMMLYTFHGPNRTGDAERKHLHESGWLMTVPLVVLGVLSAAGGWLNLPATAGFLGPTAGLEHWLDPVVGAAALRVTHGERPELAHGTEVALIGAAVAIALAGIALAWLRLKPAALAPKRESPVEERTGVERLLAHKYYVDEAYDAAIVRPAYFASDAILRQGLDEGIIDKTLVVGVGWGLPRAIARIGSWIQSGSVGSYAWVLLIGVIAVLGAFTLR